MLVLPYQTSATEFNVYIGLDPEQFDRIRENDPTQFDLTQIGPGFEHLRLRRFTIGLCTAEDTLEVQRLIRAGAAPKQLLQYLFRGWKFRPDRGDYDGPALSLRDEPGSKPQ